MAARRLTDADVAAIAATITQVVTDRPMTVQEAAAYTGKSVKTLQNLRALGKGPRCTGSGFNVRYRKADLDEWLTST